jgi:UDP-4-amino-4,6-dideoxy-N-acetyl-beta-L-altrosamine transaminase
MIPYGRQHIDQTDIDAVVGVLRSDFLTQGPAVPAFEAAVAQYAGAARAVAVNSATSALHIACMALDLGPGDVLWTVPNTFLASANCALYCGADVDFVDIDPRTRNMSAEALSSKLARAADRGRLPKVVVPVHFAGEPCDMEAIGAAARRHGVKVIEDASHAVGARYRDTRIGDARYSDIVVFSFHPVKIVTTAEGGMALTQDAELARRMRLARSHGMEREPARFAAPPEGDWVYEMQTLGYNYRLTDLQAALGLAQMARVNAFVERRKAIADRYDRLLAELPLKRPARTANQSSAWHLYVVEMAHAEPSRAAVFARLRGAGIGVAVHYIPVHLQPLYRARGFSPGNFPHAEAYYARCLSLPMYPDLSDSQQDRVVQVLAEALA